MISPGSKPQLCWLDTKEITTGYFEPELDQLLHVPGSDQYLGRGIQIVRSNMLRGRPKLPDSLNIRYLTEYDGNSAVKVNATLHGGPGCLCRDGLGETFWKGPIVVYLKAGADFDAAKMAHMSLAAYRDAIDYLAYFRETVGSMIDPMGGVNDRYGNVIMGSRVGKVKGVRLNCLGDLQSGDGTPATRQELVQVDVPKALEVDHGQRSPRGSREGRSGRSQGAGSLLEERVEPLFASKVEVDGEKVLGELEEEVLERYMQEV